MSGFGLRALKKQEDHQSNETKTRYVKHLVVGESVYGFLTFNKLMHGQDQLAWITSNPYWSQEIHRDYLCLMNAVRSEEVADELSFSNFQLSPATESVLFYKDTKFHKFGGRAKSHTLAEGEEFFTQAYSGVEQTLEVDEEKVKQCQLNKIIKSIEVVEPSDLVEPTHFIIHTGDGEMIRCESLYYCDTPKSFYQLVEDKSLLGKDLQKYLVGIQNHPGITVHFECQAQVTEHEGTMLIPQSLTHEWGSFILDIEKFNGGTQNFRALTFVAEDDLQEEDLAKKIRLMRRVLERVLPELAVCKYTTTIKYDQAMRITGMDDTLAGELKNQAVRFVGPGAPIMHPKSELFQYFARASMSLSQL